MQPAYKPARLFFSAAQRSFSPTISNMPDLPAIDWSRIGQSAPHLVSSTSTALPAADVIVLTWAEAEWAAMQHVFCASASTMPYTARSTSSWSGWSNYAQDLPSNPPSGWSFWGEWRLVQIAGRSILLFKSNTHLDFPGPTQLTELIQRLIAEVKPALVLSIGTAGGAVPTDHLGTVRAISAGTLYQANRPSTAWPVYKNSWTANDTLLNNAGFAGMLFPIPTTASDLQSLCTQFNRQYKTSYTLAELNPGNLNLGDPSPKLDDQTGGSVSLLTTPTFVVGATSGDYAAYACIEMDDALLAQACDAAGISFGAIRNISDPVQNVALPAKIQGNWGSTIYDTYGLYTSYNGALSAAAILAAN